MPTATDATFDVVVLGGGSGGYACALRAAELGLSAALVERDKLGGTCLHKGCIPTKALLHAAEVADSARGAAAFGVQATLDGIDPVAVGRYRDGVVARLYKGLQGLVKSRAVTFIEGDGRLIDAHTVSVGEQHLTGRTVVLATGSAARSLPGVEVGGRIMTSDEALLLDEVPGSVIVLGGGVIGVEFASVWRSFGSDVTILEALPRLVSAEDEAIGTALQRAFRKRGIATRTGVSVTEVSQDDACVQVHLDDGSTLTADRLLMAIGRGPRSEDTGFAEAGVKLDRGHVVVDERLRTSLDGVRAVGDLVAGLQLAHRGFAHGIFVAEDLAGLEPAPVEDRTIPRVTYCDPEIVSVGLTTQQAGALGEVESYDYNLAGNGKSQILATSGFVKLVRLKDGPIVGVHAVGARMSEQAGEAQLLVGWEAHPEDVTALLHAHPTQNEALGEAALALAGKPLHAHA